MDLYWPTLPVSVCPTHWRDTVRFNTGYGKGNQMRVHSEVMFQVNYTNLPSTAVYNSGFQVRSIALFPFVSGFVNSSVFLQRKMDHIQSKFLY